MEASSSTRRHTLSTLYDSGTLAVTYVKVEKESDGTGECGASEEAAAGLYVEHEVKEELVLGPERLQPQDIAYASRQPFNTTDPGTVKQELLAGEGAEAELSGEASCSHKSYREQFAIRKVFIKECSIKPGLEIRVQQRLLDPLADQDGNVAIKSNPKLWKPPMTRIAPNVLRTPEGSMRSFRSVSDTTPNASLKRGRELEQSIHSTAAKRAAACDLDEEVDATVEENCGHIRKSVSELPPLETLDTTPACSKPVSGVCDNVSGIVGVNAAKQPQPGSNGGGLQYTVDHQDVRPSKLTAGLVADDSEFDSDFNDEIDLNGISGNGGITRGIPDDEELDEPISNIINSVERAMDEAIERLVSVSTEFEWQVDFDTFHGVPEIFSGPTPGSVKDYDTPYEAFTDIWSRDFMENIARETNRYANQVINEKIAAGTLEESSRLRRWVDTDVNELYVLFAVYILMGIGSRKSEQEYFKSGGYIEMPKFRKLLTYNRFILLSKFLHFVDNCDASQELPQSEGPVLSAKARKIAPVLSHLNAKFRSLYNLHQDVVIDESLTLFKDRLFWARAIGSKAERFGIKSYELTESRTGYLYTYDIYTGKNVERDNVAAPNVDFADKSIQAVLDLLKGLERRGHCVAMDNFYNSPALARHLKSLGFDCLGTLRASRKNLPKDIANAPENVAKGTIIARHCGDVSCIAWKDTKMVKMISTYHTAETLGKKAGRVEPIVVRDYNNTMGGIDLKDQQLSMYLMERKRCLKWYMKIFRRLLNVSVHNSLVLLLSSLRRRNMPVTTHRDFREQLANSLVAAHRPSPREISAPATEVTRLRNDLVHVPMYLTSTTRMRCHMCLRKGIVKMVYLKCVTCDEGMCFDACWRDWHSLHVLPGNNIQVRKGRRRR